MRTIKLILAMVGVAVLLLLSVLAHESGELHIESVDAAQVKILEKEFVGQEINGLLGSFFGNERINILIKKDNDEKITVGIESEKGKVTIFKVGALSDPTLMFITNEKTIKEIVTSEDTLKTVRMALKSGDLDYKAVGFKNRLKYFVIFKVRPLAGLFKGETQAKDENTVVVNGLEGPATTATEGATTASDASSSAGTNATNGTKSTSSPAVQQNVESVSEPQATAETQNQSIPAPNDDHLHIIKLTNAGFEKVTLTISVGESVEWVNVRNASLNTAFMIGTRSCHDLRSTIFKPGESYRYTFTKPMTCIVADGIYTKQAMTVTVE